MIGDNAVEQAIDESGRFARTESLGQLDCLVDRHFGRRTRLEENFIGSQAENAAINGRHSAQRPVLSNLLDYPVDLLDPFADSGDELEGKLAQVTTAQPLLDELAVPFLFVSGIPVRFVEQLQSDFTRTTSSCHNIAIVLANRVQVQSEI